MDTTLPQTGARPAPAADPARPDPRRWWGLAVISLAQLMVVLDMTIVNIALPSAQADLGISDADRQWVITAYTLAFGGLLLLGGRIGDLIGRKRAMIIGLIGFAAASAIGGVAATGALLLGARALQGVFAALLAPAALSLVSVTFTEPHERARAFGIYGAIAGGGSAVGLILGGLLTEYLDWRWCLLVNAPIAILAVLGASAFLHDQRKEAETRLDVLGAVLASGGLLAIVYGLSEAEQHGWTSGFVLSLLAGGLVLLALFVVAETRVAHPLLPLRVLRDRNRAGALLSVGLTTVGMFGMFLFLTYYLQVTLGYSPVRTGLAFLPLTAGMMTGAVGIAARLLPRVPARMIMTPGLLVAATALILLTRIEVDSSYVTHVLPSMVLLGIGMGSTFMPAMSTATFGVEPRDAGVASATVNTAQQVGGSIGIALLNTVATSATARYLTTHGSDPLAQAAGVVHGFSVAIWWAVAFLLTAAVAAAVLITARPAAVRAADDGAATSAEPVAVLV
ncbi:MFS transporter [Pengzhenrongella frigida]|uniref:DHA2 family efflux MFS transporter permease subunit n=1 Tax=Pengzhenrongella frigida TaxID=1259133 RepID=A0A4Q5N418_9MICO|nr:MFS transporter [Cellulomonas sp. HLT2-17]RYV52998.1 DHA2 family efflux MFS transporter permease subunit [Cellulomonas sp. HLT2-17]